MKPSIVTISCVVTLLLAACVQDQKAMHEPQVKSVPTPAQTGRTPETKREIFAQVLASEQEAVEADQAAPAIIRKRAASKHSPVLYAPSSVQSMPSTATHMVNREVYGVIDENGVKLVREEPVSTFSIDVDTGAYAVVRRHLNDGVLPPGNAVRVEELINYFDYAYAVPDDRETPFSISTEIAPTPWNSDTHLVKVGLQGYQPEAEDRAPANLVFLIDVSGSMGSADKLPLLKNAFRLLVKQLDEKDTITMVVYAGSSGVALETTPGDRQADILAALDRLSAGGSTHGSSGIKLAYSMAEQAYIKKGINRVILATDGDFNVGTVNHDALLDLIERNKQKGISLTTLGFGSGNYNDHLMEQLADHGDGNYAYIDNLNEARKTLVEQVSATLQTIARDVKIQIEWNPAVVSEYRLIGYENRLLQREDFNNDKVDAGEIGAGHNVTAMYEITLADSKNRRIDGLRYQEHKKPETSLSDEMALVKLRYKKPGQQQSKLVQHVLHTQDVKLRADKASNNLRFAAAVAAFGDMLRGGDNLNAYGYTDIIQLARRSRGNDHKGYRAEFVRLVELASRLDSRS